MAVRHEQDGAQLGRLEAAGPACTLLLLVSRVAVAVAVAVFISRLDRPPLAFATDNRAAPASATTRRFSLALGKVDHLLELPQEELCEARIVVRLDGRLVPRQDGVHEADWLNLELAPEEEPAQLLLRLLVQAGVHVAG